MRRHRWSIMGIAAMEAGSISTGTTGVIIAIATSLGDGSAGERAAYAGETWKSAKRGPETVRAFYLAKFFARRIRTSLQWPRNSATVQRSTRLCQHS